MIEMGDGKKIDWIEVSGLERACLLLPIGLNKL
jgi:hypothetical protein